MNKFSVIPCLWAAWTSVGSFAQDNYVFTDLINLPHTQLKSQGASGTCWSFSGISFLESEMIRKGGPNIELSEMFVVNHCYEAKIEKYIRMRQTMVIGEGGEAHDVIWAVDNFGIVPRANYRTSGGIDHSVLVQDVLEFASGAAADNEDTRFRVSPLWRKAARQIINGHLGEAPSVINFNGKDYSPKEFAHDVVRFNANDYVCIGSYLHHPFYKPFVLEVPDNWLMGQIHNVPLDELVAITDSALSRGYSLIWGADVSEDYFFSDAGVAIVPQTAPDSLSSQDRAAFKKLSPFMRRTWGMVHYVKEAQVTPQMRQDAFDSYATTDDHGMHIVGLAKDTNGTLFYKVKNSWGRSNAQKGYMYVSKQFFRYKTIDIMVHKDAIPKNIREKLGI